MDPEEPEEPVEPEAPAPTLRVLIVDDDAAARARARRLLAEVAGVEIAGEAGTAAEARAAIAARRPDLLLLDVQLAGEDGLALLATLVPLPAVVFVTGFDAALVRAFEQHACDYLLKPYRAERLRAAIERARGAREDGAGAEARVRAVLRETGREA